eukprot:scaffold273029_cov17-Tisochrysis_lutea.AAC.2
MVQPHTLPGQSDGHPVKSGKTQSEVALKGARLISLPVLVVITVAAVEQHSHRNLPPCGPQSHSSH